MKKHNLSLDSIIKDKQDDKPGSVVEWSSI